METQGPTDGTTPTPAEAEAALLAAEEARAAVAQVRTPLWYFVALGALVAVVGPAVSLVPDPPAGVLVILGGVALWVTALVTIMQLVVRQMGVLVWLDERQLRPLFVIMGSLLAVAVVAEAGLDPSWGPEALTVLAGAGVVVFGVHHRRSS
jgi:hypothetical protein